MKSSAIQSTTLFSCLINKIILKYDFRYQTDIVIKSDQVRTHDEKYLKIKAVYLF